MNDEVSAIFNENVLGSIATINEDGSPWVTPVHVFADQEAVYWFSQPDTQHSLNISRDPRVSLSLFSTDMSKGPKGVYINGSATALGVDATTEAQKLIEVRIGQVPAHFMTATAYRLKIGELNRGKSVGNCWYFYT